MQSLRALVMIGGVACGVACSVAEKAQAQQLSPMALSARAIVTRADTITTPENWDGWQLSHCVTGVTYGAPLKFAVAYGGGFRREFDESPDLCVMGVAKLGLGGAQASVGVGSSFGALGGGGVVTANVLRTFSNPLHATARRTYVGASVHLWPIIAIGGEIGWYTRIGDAAGASTAGKRLIAWSTGFGF